MAGTAPILHRSIPHVVIAIGTCICSKDSLTIIKFVPFALTLVGRRWNNDFAVAIFFTSVFSMQAPIVETLIIIIIIIM